MTKIKRLIKWMRGYDYKLKYRWYDKVGSVFLNFVFFSSGIYVILNRTDKNIVIAFGTICLFSGFISALHSLTIHKRRIKELMEKQ